MVTEPCDPMNVASLGSWAAERDNQVALSVTNKAFMYDGHLPCRLPPVFGPCEWFDSVSDNNISSTLRKEKNPKQCRAVNK